MRCHCSSKRARQNVADGSKTVLSALESDFCNTRGSGHLQYLSACLKRASSGLMQRKKSFDNLLGAGKQCCRYGKIKCFDRLVIDDQVKPGGLLNRQITGLCASQDAIHVGSGLLEKIDVVDAVRHQSTLSNVIAVGIRCRDTITRSERDDLPAEVGE